MNEELLEQAITAPIDWLVIVGAVVLVTAYGYTFGKDYIVPMLFTLYMAGFAMIVVPYTGVITAMIEAPAWLSSAIVFLAVYLIFFFIVKSNGFFEPYVVPTGMETVTFCLVATGFATMVVMSFMSPDDQESLTSLTRMVFTGDVAVTLWTVAPVVSLLLIRGET